MIFRIALLIWCLWLVENRVITLPRQARLSLAEHVPSYYYTNIDGVPGTYSFGYDVLDAWSGNTQYRNEERYPNGTVVGSYGYIDAYGRPLRYRYIADERGYRVTKEKPRPMMAVPINSIPNYNKQENSVTWSRKKLQTKKINRNYFNSEIHKANENAYRNLNNVFIY